LPIAEARLVQRGFSGSFGGLSGLKPMWQKPQVIPIRYGGSTLAGSAMYLFTSHVTRSNLGFLNLRRPMTPDDWLGMPGMSTALQLSIQRPYSSGCVAAVQSGSFRTPMILNRSGCFRESTY